jgi:hypothetical protein
VRNKTEYTAHIENAVQLTLVDLQLDAQNSCLFSFNTFYWYICLACFALQILMTG